MNHLKAAITWGFYWFIQDLWHYLPCNSIKKLDNYIIKGTNLAWFRSYLTNREQYIQITNDSKRDLPNTTCRIPQGSIIGPLVFLVYFNDLPSSSKICFQMAKIFFMSTKITKLFATVNEELMNINYWFMANKLSLNVGKTKYSLFHKPSRVDDLVPDTKYW